MPFCVAIIIQAIICFFILSEGGTLSQIESDSYNLFEKRVENRADYFENEMVYRWSDITAYAQNIESTINAVLVDEEKKAADLEMGAELTVKVIESVVYDLVTYTEHAEVNGLYLFIGSSVADSDGLEKYSGLYIQDSNPKINPGNRSDLLLGISPISISKELDIALASNWASSVTMPEGEESAFFYSKPREAALEHPEAYIEDLGYWGRPYDISAKGTQAITYSIPLRDHEGEFLGVLGVEIDTTQLTSLFPYQEIDDEGSGSYLLATTEDDGSGLVIPNGGRQREYEILVSNGASHSLYVQEGIIYADYDEREYTIASLVHNAAEETAILSVQEISLYNATSPFAGDHWVLIGIEQEKELFSSSKMLFQSIIGVVLISLGLGLAIAAATAWLSSSRLKLLMDQVRNTRPEDTIEFTPTQINEIDELADSIKKLGSDVVASASRLSQIMKLSDRGVGAYEYNKEANTMYYTETLFDVLGVDNLPKLPDGVSKDDVSNRTLSAEGFWKLMECYDPYLDEAESTDDIFVFEVPEAQRWIRFARIKDDEQQRIFGLIEDVTQELSTRKQIEHERDHDILTGLLSRRAFESGVREALKSRSTSVAAMVMIDLDNLKYINDSYGHDWGDFYIKTTAEAISAAASDEDICSRISGDEFMIFILGRETKVEVEQMVESLRESLIAHSFKDPDGELMKIRASIGVAYYPDDAENYEQLREYADFAMYMAKNNMKGGVYFFSKQSYEQKSFILDKKEDLNRLLDEKLVDYHFQPIVDARNGQVMAYEALMRSRMESLPSPDIILELARSQSKLYLVEKLTFFESMRAFQAFDLPENIRLFVNSIGTQRLSDEDEIALREAYGDLVKRLVIEITESDYNRDLLSYKEKMAREWGSRLAIDDYGSGYSNNSLLLKVTTDYVKIDMSIVRNIDKDVDREDILAGILSYAHERGIKVIAEGVETQGELAKLIALNIDYVQGYFVGRPIPHPTDIDVSVRETIVRYYGKLNF